MSSSYFSDSSVPSISTTWSENAAPLSQTREQTRDDIRRILNMPVSLESLSIITRNMNVVADLSPSTVTTIEASLAEFKTLEQQRTEVQSSATWDGAAPIKKADVIEYDTELLAAKDAIVTQTQGINARMGQIEMEIRIALNMGHGQQTARMYRS